MGWPVPGLASLYVAAILAITSTALTVKLLEQKGLVGREEVPFLVASLVVEDIFAVFALVFFSAMGKTSSSMLGVATTVLTALAALGVAYFVVFAVLNRVLAWLTQYETQETVLFLGFALAVGFSVFAQQIGLSASIGAFLAGSIVASLPKGRVLQEALSPFALAFSSIFFLSVGMAVDLRVLESHFVLVAAFVVLGSLFKFFATGTSMYLNGFSSKSAVFGGAAMLATGEFSLLIASEGGKALPGLDLVSLTSITVFLSVLVSSLAIDRHEAIHSACKSLVPDVLRSVARRNARSMESIMDALAAAPFAVRRRFHEAELDIAGISVVLAATAVALWFFSGRVVVVQGVAVPVYFLVLAAGALLLALLLYGVACEVLAVFGYVRERCVRVQARAGRWVAFLLLASLVLVVPFAFALAGKEVLLTELALLALVIAAAWYAINLKEPKNRAPSLMFCDPRWNQGPRKR